MQGNRKEFGNWEILTLTWGAMQDIKRVEGTVAVEEKVETPNSCKIKNSYIYRAKNPINFNAQRKKKKKFQVWKVHI